MMLYMWMIFSHELQDYEKPNDIKLNIGSKKSIYRKTVNAHFFAPIWKE